jgi:hypothetical protein
VAVVRGSLSSDGWWYWDGAQWSPAISRDGRWHWDGVRWTPTDRRSWLDRLWEPPWLRRDTNAAVRWLIATPAALAVSVVGFAVLARAGSEWVLVASLSALLAWAFVGGLLLRPHGRWREIFIIAGTLTVIVCAVYSAAIFAAPDPTDQNDHVAAIGNVIVVCAVMPPLTLMAALGRLFRVATRRALQRVRRRDVTRS